MVMEWTPGPWISREHPEGLAGVSLPTGRMVARCEGMFGRQHVASSEWQANARLIAAAPELYEALAEVVAKFDVSDDATERNTPLGIMNARAALAKATGQ